MDPQPTKEDIEAVFQRLRAVPANKVCFDCNAKNPTWSSVTYGIFICIDCSAVHRSLGVHLTFVRSTQLDTNWTWLQLRQMQVGGNRNAVQFFAQHNCVTSDSQKKYNSRAAQLYREKLAQAALDSLTSNNKLHTHPQQEETAYEKEVDFFSETENILSMTMPSQPLQMKEDDKDGQNPNKSFHTEEGPKTDYLLDSADEPQKSTIAPRKTGVKKSMLGAKKTGLGAVKVKTNFAELEKEAELAEEPHINTHVEPVKNKTTSSAQQEEREAVLRLVYKEVHSEQQKQKNQLKTQDPMKVEQLERLGMGISSKTGVSHSALSDMEMIEQENMPSTTNTLSYLGKLRVSDDSFFDDYSYGKSSFSMNRSTPKDYGKDGTSLFENYSSKDSWVIVNDAPEKPPKSNSSFGKREEKPVRSTNIIPDSNKAQKEFGNAKAISSDQFFHDQRNDFEVKANLSRFKGSSSISSADLFGTETAQLNNTSYDIEDVKESVRQGVTKVAGKLGSIANGLMSSIQDRYGY